MTDTSVARPGCAASSAPAGAPCTLIAAQTLRAWLNDAQELALFDVREAGQFGEGHLFFAVPLPYSRLEHDVQHLAPRRAVRMVLVDDGDGLAQRAAARLAELGYSEIAVLEHGVQGWVQAGYTLFKGVNLPSKTFGELVEQAYRTPHIDADELARRQAAGEQLVLLDGRTAPEHTKMTVPGALNCPNGELAWRLDALVTDPGTPIVIHCAGRTRSIMGAQTLRELGVPNPVLALENGTQGWFLAGLPLEHGSTRTAPPVPDTRQRAAARARVQALVARRALAALDEGAARAWLADTQRTTLVLDVRSPQEWARAPVPGVRNAPGGQLLQATDQYVGVRRGRVLLIDDDGVRAPVIAHWLLQLGVPAGFVAPETALALRDAFARLQADGAAAQSGTVAPRAGAPVLRHLDASALQALVERDAALQLIDLRSSAAFAAGHARGARWGIRPTLLQLLREQAPAPGTAVVLFADEPVLAELAARDVGEAGYGDVCLAGTGLQTWIAAGLPLAEAPQALPPAARIDYLFFVHDRHDGNAQAARDYLDWETGLLAQCASDELAVFKLA